MILTVNFSPKINLFTITKTSNSMRTVSKNKNFKFSVKINFIKNISKRHAIMKHPGSPK